jgi:hypothetical protein
MPVAAATRIQLTARSRAHVAETLVVP